MNEKIEIGDWIVDEDNMLRGKVVGKGTIGKRIPAYKIDYGGGRITAIPKEYARLWFKEEIPT